MTIDVDDRDWFTWEGVARIRNACEKQAMSEGLSGLELFFRGQDLFTKQLVAAPSYRERQKKWADAQVSKSKPSPLLDALQEIADGHNDPRKLATDVLRMMQEGR